MKDQANKLREMALNLRNQIEADLGKEIRHTRVISVSSGKGGVGKSTLALNLALKLCAMGKRVLIMDADLGMANIDIMLGLVPKYNLYHMIRDKKPLKDIIINGPGGLKIIPGGSGMNELANLQEEEMKRILVEMGKLDGDYDYMVVDTGAGISNNVVKFLLAGDDVIVLTTPEPTSLTDAYGVVKSVNRYGFNGNIYLVVNRVARESEGILVAQKFKLVSEKFLALNINILGYIVQDYHVEQGIRRQEAFAEAFPNSLAAQNITDIAERLLENDGARTPVLPARNGGIKGFIKKLTGFARL
ncbi:MAG: MinD/ParA family protein [Syntrophomonas sp.]|nr:MinD/ParA family protein [Syntrophomonas sp.]